MKTAAIIKMGGSALMANLSGRRFPLNLMLSVTNRCVSHCSYCNIPQRGQKELSLGQIRSLVDEAARMGCQRIGLWGGEPLLREDIADIVGYIKSKGLFLTLDTNGHLLPQKLKAIDGLDHVIVALDGPKDAHERNRGEDSFQRAMAAIDAASGVLPLWTITVLTRHNLDAVDFILENARRYGFLATFQLLHHNERLSRNHEALMPPDEEYRTAIRRIIAAKQKGEPVASSFPYLRHLLNWPDFRSPVSTKPCGSFRCWAGRLYCNIDTDGTVYPCSLLVDKIKADNFLVTGLRGAFGRLRTGSCESCIASCFTEYNLLYSLNGAAIAGWVASMRRTGKRPCATPR